MESVSKHAGTSRGRLALLSLAKSASIASDKSLLSATAAKRSMETINIIKISSSASEAREEYELVRQAAIVLQAKRKECDTNDENESKNDNHTEERLSIPPIYGTTSSPWDVNTADTDDDEWLSAALSGHVLSIGLEDIIKADQVVRMILETKQWANLELTQLRAPGLSHIASSINGEILESLHAEIANSVEIVRMRSISDPTGRQVSACSTKKDAVHKFSKDCVETNDLHISFADLLISSEYEDVSKVEVASPQRA